MSSRTIIKKSKNSLEKDIKLDSSINSVNKNNLNTNSSCISDLFKIKHNNSLIRRFDVSISFLSLSNKSYPLNNNSEKQNITFKELSPEFKRIMKEEFADAIMNLEYNKMISI